VFLPSKPFLLGLMFESTDGAHLCEAPFNCSSLRYAVTNIKSITVNYSCKKLYSISPRQVLLGLSNLADLYVNVLLIVVMNKLLLI